VGPSYIRHDEAGDRTVARDDYAKKSAKAQQEQPGIRVVVYDHTFEGDRAWFRFAFKWTDPKTGETRSRAGMQAYRIEAGKLAETWLFLQPLGRMPLHKSTGRARRRSNRAAGVGSRRRGPPHPDPCLCPLSHRVNRQLLNRCGLTVLVSFIA